MEIKPNYFPHDFNARNDIKIQALLHDYKARGYGLYWILIEMLHEASEHKIALKTYSYIALSQITNESPDFVEKVISACINKYDLFFEVDGFLQCKRVNINIDRRIELSNKRALAGKEGANAKQMLANAKQNEANKKKGKEIKEKEINIPFDTFWDKYDKKEDRKKCELKWEALTDEEREKIMQVLPDYVRTTPDVRFRKNPLTFFNARSWEDEAMQKRGNVYQMQALAATGTTGVRVSTWVPTEEDEY